MPRHGPSSAINGSKQAGRQAAVFSQVGEAATRAGSVGLSVGGCHSQQLADGCLQGKVGWVDGQGPSTPPAGCEGSGSKEIPTTSGHSWGQPGPHSHVQVPAALHEASPAGSDSRTAGAEAYEEHQAGDQAMPAAFKPLPACPQWHGAAVGGRFMRWKRKSRCRHGWHSLRCRGCLRCFNGCLRFPGTLRLLIP